MSGEIIYFSTHCEFNCKDIKYNPLNTNYATRTKALDATFISTIFKLRRNVVVVVVFATTGVFIVWTNSELPIQMCIITVLNGALWHSEAGIHSLNYRNETLANC